MKFIKTIFGVFLFVVAVLLLIGVFIPEVDDEFEVRIERPVMEVFAGMLNTSNLPNWIKGLDEIKSTGGFLAMPGSTFDLYYRNKETESIYKVEILEMIPMQSVKFKMYNDMVIMEVSLKFESDGSVTIVTVYAKAKGEGVVARSFLPLLSSVLADELRENLNTFKKLQEQP